MKHSITRIGAEQRMSEEVVSEKGYFGEFGGSFIP